MPHVHLDDALDLDDGPIATLDARLRHFLAQHSEARPCELSTTELARLFARTPKHPDGDERQIQRSVRRIRRTYGARLVEVRRRFGRATLPPLRWIEEPGGNGRSDLSSDDEIDLRALDRTATSERARARASRAKRRPVAERPRRRAVPLPPVPHPGRHVAPYELGESAAAAIEAHYGPERGPRVVGAIRAELDSIRRGDYAGRPVEAGRALRTLPLRPLAHTPVAYFRDLFRSACGGDLLCDADEDADRVRDVERDAALEHDGPLDFDAGELTGGQSMSADDLIAAAADRMRQRTAAEIYPRGLPWWERPEPSAESKRFGVVLEHLRTMPVDHPLRAGLQREATLLYQRGVRPPDRDTGPPPERPP